MTAPTSDTEPREPGCQCQWEVGDSPCRVHGEGDPVAPAAEPPAPTCDELATEHVGGKSLAEELARVRKERDAALRQAEEERALARRLRAQRDGSIEAERFAEVTAAARLAGEALLQLAGSTSGCLWCGGIECSEVCVMLRALDALAAAGVR